MAWSGARSLEPKSAAAWLGEQRQKPIAGLCAELGIDRDTYYQARARFDAEGITGLLPRSRRPHRSPTQTVPAVEEAIVRARKELAEEGWDNGARSIGFRLARQGLAPPAVATIHRVLRRRGLVSDQPQKRPKSATRRFEFADRNGCWQMDGTKWRLSTGRQVVIIGAVDDHTRVALAPALRRPATRCVGMSPGAASCYGQAGADLTDNGVALNGTRRGRQTDFTRNLAALGVNAISARAYHPQTCGKRERLNATLKRWLTRQPRAATLAQLQTQLDLFDTVYNARPHQSLRGSTPDERWSTAPAAQPQPLPPPAPRITTVKVDARGSVPVAEKRLIGVGRRYEGITVTVITYRDQTAIFHRNTLLRRLTIDPTRRYQPTGVPRGGRHQTRILSVKK